MNVSGDGDCTTALAWGLPWGILIREEFPRWPGSGSGHCPPWPRSGSGHCPQNQPGWAAGSAECHKVAGTERGRGGAPEL